MSAALAAYVHRLPELGEPAADLLSLAAAWQDDKRPAWCRHNKLYHSDDARKLAACERKFLEAPMKAFEREERRAANPREMARLRRGQGGRATGPLFDLSAVCVMCCTRKLPMDLVGGVIESDPVCLECFIPSCSKCGDAGTDPGPMPKRRIAYG